MLSVTGQTQKHVSGSTHPRDPEQQVRRGGRLNRDSQGWGGRNWEPVFHGYWYLGQRESSGNGGWWSHSTENVLNALDGTPYTGSSGEYGVYFTIIETGNKM